MVNLRWHDTEGTDPRAMWAYTDKVDYAVHLNGGKYTRTFVFSDLNDQDQRDCQSFEDGRQQCEEHWKIISSPSAESPSSVSPELPETEVASSRQPSVSSPCLPSEQGPLP